MRKYRIINNETNQVICRKNGRHFRQSQGFISDGLKELETTKGRAEKECEYLNENYYSGWEIEELKEQK